MKTPTPSTHDPAQEDLLLKYQERVDKRSQQNRVIKFCTDAGFLTTVDVGQYFMTKDTEDFSQFTVSVACREYTLPRDEKSSDPKGWIRGNTKIGPVFEVATSCLQGEYGVEIKIMSVNKDHSHYRIDGEPMQFERNVFPRFSLFFSGLGRRCFARHISRADADAPQNAPCL